MALVALASGRFTAAHVAGAQAAEAPLFEVDPLWPKPLPNHWLFGWVVGVSVDARDNIHVVQRTAIGENFNGRTEVGAATNPPTGECCVPAPPVLVFAQDGSLVRSWGGPGEGYTWPKASHRIALDRAGNAWIGGSGDGDAQILKFSGEGRFVTRIAEHSGSGPVIVIDGATQSRALFASVAKVSFDNAANEAYVADPRSRRVVVIDAGTGAVKRVFGAYGEAPKPDAIPAYDPAAAPARQFRNVQCAEPAGDGLVYVCDREANRIQVFRKNGTYVKEKVIAPKTLGEGAVWDLAFSRDPQQRFLYVADGSNMKIHILDRQSLDVLTSFGNGGRQPGQFLAVNSIATDSRGNLYTAEMYEGKRVQKFTFRGVGPVPGSDQGVLWPVRR